ncbi:MAG: hypothetical protein AAGB19_02895 [Cyanobacteria bacterium P01_F01_bin.3]
MSSAASRPQGTSMSSAQFATGTSSLTQSNAQHVQSPAAPSPPSMVSRASSTPESKVNGSVSASAEAEKPSADKADLRKPPSRSLLKPPARPKPPKPVAPAAAPAATKPAIEEPPTPQRPGPISLPSEPMQYRAIGLLKGKYKASEEQFNRGDIIAEDGTVIDAVLLGRVTSLIKKHLELDKEHLWVVYPRTLYKDKEDAEEAKSDTEEANADGSSDEKESVKKGPEDSGLEEKVPALHVQIVGVWEPETLNADAEYENEEDRPLSSEEAEDLCNQFSIRGEIAKYAEESGEITVNIVQKSKSETAKPKRPFKLLVSGKLTGRTTGYFWDLKVERQDGKLVLVEGKSIAVVPPKKKPKGKKGGRRRPGGGNSKPRSAAAPPKPKPKPKAAGEPAPSEVSATSVATEAADA